MDPWDIESWVAVDPPVLDFGEVGSIKQLEPVKVKVRNVRHHAIRLNFQHAYRHFNLIYDESEPRITLAPGLSYVSVSQFEGSGVGKELKSPDLKH